MSINIYQHRSTGQDLALGRSRGAMALLGSRQESCEVIHQQERIGNLRDQGCDKSLWNQKGPKEFRGIQLFFNMTLGHVMLCHGMSLIMLTVCIKATLWWGWHGMTWVEPQPTAPQWCHNRKSARCSGRDRWEARNWEIEGGCSWSDFFWGGDPYAL